MIETKNDTRLLLLLLLSLLLLSHRRLTSYGKERRKKQERTLNFPIYLFQPSMYNVIELSSSS